MVPKLRIQACNQAHVNRDGEYVIYWMIAHRRLSWNFSLDRALEWCEELGQPLLILEALRCDYRWASDRLHGFVLQGMKENARRCRRLGVAYYPYLEPKRGAGKGLLAELARSACVIVTDDFPCFFLPNMVQAAAEQVGVKMEKVDSNGLLPMRAAEKFFARAYDFRRFLQKNLPDHLLETPSADPIEGLGSLKGVQVPEAIRKRWPKSELDELEASKFLAELPIDHSVSQVETRGGSSAAEDRLHRFLASKLEHYADKRNEPEADATSGLSPYLHFGNISVHEVFAALTGRENWNLNCLSPDASGSRSGWWGLSQGAEAFLDELITWRELGYNMCWQTKDYDRFESLPDWARATLTEHRSDEREYIYGLREFDRAQTHDPLWNAAQTQLLREGRIHNYLRMLWGKKILEWSPSAQEALKIMIELNNKYALDGRNPNSYSGIFWVLGRYDRAWGPERPIFGKVRYMSSENTARKFPVKNYIEEYTP